MCHQPNKNKHNGDGDMMIQGKLMEKPLLRKPSNEANPLCQEKLLQS